MRRLGRLSFVALTTATFGGQYAMACSSVPDVRYEDLEGGVEGASDQRSEPAPRPQYACPNQAPPQGEGRCCGDKLCANCKDDSDCQKCDGENCAGTMEEACCRRNPAQTDCRAFYSCN